ncbi:hypothetical protein SAMN02990966_05747 [Rhodospirillales bacterium URHD0017]|nr:hypothetical protein SAMN02990966_05747 [Rhodospirillales bacterium URHD0017]
MPTIAIIDGLLILLYFNDHPPAHFFTRKALISMRDFALKTVKS